MKVRHFALAGIAGLILGSCTSGQSSPNTNAEPPTFPHAASDLVPDAGIIYGVLPNGVRYGVMHNDTPSNEAALRVRFATGSLNETEAQLGLAHFLEHMAFNGSKNIPEGEMIKRLERLGLSFGADTNAHTSFDETVYKLNMPNVSDEVIDEAFMLMRETAQNLTLDPDAIDRERGIIRSEKRTRNSAQYRLFVDRLAFYTSGSTLAERLPIGTDEMIDTMQADEFEAYYRGFYRPENTFVLLVGDIEPERAIAKITEYFADWQATGPAMASKDAGVADQQAGAVGYFHDTTIMTNITLAVSRPYIERLDTAAQRQENFIKRMGNRIVNRRLRKLRRDPEAKFLSGGIGGLGAYETAEGVSIRLRSSPELWRDALAIGEQEIRRALAYGFSQAELDEQMANSRTGYELAVENAATRKTTARFGSGLSTQILGAYAHDRVLTHPATNLEQFEALAETITPEQVWDAFKTNWQGFETPQIYLATSDKLDNPEAEIRNALKASQALAVTAPDLRERGSFAYTDFGLPGRVVSDTYIADADAHLVRFENNVLLNFKQTDFDEGRVIISMTVSGGALSIPRKDEGLRRLALNVLSQGGLEAHSKDDLQSLMAGKFVTGTLSVWMDQDAFVMTAGTSEADLGEQFNFMTASLTAPGYREEAMATYLKSFRAWYPTRNATPGMVASNTIPRLIRSGDTRYGLPALDVFLAPQMDEVKAWVGPHLKDGLIEIVVVGDIDKDTVVQEISRTFGALPARKTTRAAYPEMTRLIFPNGNQAPVILRHDGEQNQALLRIYWPAPDASDKVTVRRMRVFRSLLRNRLTSVIREEFAAAYSPGVRTYSDPLFDDYGYISVSLDLTPEKVSEMHQVVLEVTASLRAGEFSEDEFERAIRPIREDLASTFEKNGYWLNTLGDAQTDGRGIRDFRTLEQTYADMTHADIKALAANLFAPDTAFSVNIVAAPAQ